MLRQKLKSFYSFLLPRKKTARTSNQSASLQSFSNEPDSKISARIIYTAEKNKQIVPEKPVNTEHDWWIN